MLETFLKELPSSAGGEHDERLYEERAYCEGCGEDFIHTELTYSEEDEKHYCPKCLTKKQL